MGVSSAANAVNSGSAAGRGRDAANNGADYLSGPLTEKERKLIRMIRDTGYGEVKITIQDKEPVRVEELKKSIKL